MNWEDVRTLRKAGQLQKALDMAREILAAAPEDFKTRSQYEWVIFDYIKRIVVNMDEALEKKRPIDGRNVENLMAWMDEYHSLEPSVPEMVCSNILAQLVKIGKDLPKFPGIIHWVGIDGLRHEDWQPREYQGQISPSLAITIARTLCKWVKARPKASKKQMAFALEWAKRVGDRSKDTDLCWLHWDMAVLLRQMGDFQHAAELLASVIKTKRNEFWVWAEAGRLYQSEQPELALACFCRALECPAEPKFLVRAHRELAELLAVQEEYAQASQEVAITIDIRQDEGWPIGREMEVLIASPWYDPAAEGAETPKDFYSKHSTAALSLCFDIVETRAANYLGLLIPHTPKDPRPGWKPKPLSRFAIKDSKGHAWSLVGPAMKSLKFEVGTPLTLVIGRQNGDDRQTIVHVSVRKDGQQWDSLDSGVGVITSEATADKSIKVLIVESGEEVKIDGSSGKSLHIGDGVQCGFARNPKSNRMDVFNVERRELPEKDVKRVIGQLRRNPKGFGFVEDAFAPPHIVESIDPSIDEVVALAVYAKNPAKGEYGWRVFELNAA
ncbi:MAG: tetratricopeptide repeat protein [Propionivibrio sp.]|nr:tetratricopeptide repeat protein [Propionivibrio sp.]